MKTIGVRDLKARISETLREVQEGEIIEVTSHGHVIARIVPAASKGTYKSPADDPRNTIRNLDALRAEISAFWPETMSVEDVLDEMRR